MVNYTCRLFHGDYNYMWAIVTNAVVHIICSSIDCIDDSCRLVRVYISSAIRLGCVPHVCRSQMCVADMGACTVRLSDILHYIVMLSWRQQRDCVTVLCKE